MPNTDFDCTQIVGDADQLRQLTQRAVTSREAEAFESLEARFNQFDCLLGQAGRRWSVIDAEKIADKLETGITLTAAELELLREIIAGDAAQSGDLEEEVTTRIEQLSQLVEQINRQVAGLDVEDIPELRSSVKDSIHLLTHLRQYAAEQARLERFDNAVSDLSMAARRVLAESLRGRLEDGEL